MKKCVFSGTFDPPTTGHTRIIEECLAIFDSVTVAVMVNTDKRPYLTVEERVRLLNKLYADDGRVKVVSFSGAAVDLLAEEGTRFYVRGIRDTLDFEYENRNAFANKKLMEDIITIYLPAGQDSLQISSTLVRNSVKFEKDFSEYVPKKILADFLALTEDRDV